MIISSMASSASLLIAMWRTRLPGMGRAPVARSSACENGFTLPPRGPARVPPDGAPGYRTRYDRERHAELLGAMADLIAVHAACERLVLEFLLDRRHLEIREALGRTHQGACDQESTQLVDREERLRHGRVARHAGVGRVSQHRPQQRLGDAFGAQQIDAPGGMTLGGRVLGVGEFLVVEVVQQADETPRLGILTEYGGISPHRGLYREHVLA